MNVSPLSEVVSSISCKDGDIEQGELDLEPEPAAQGHLMQALDKLNDRYGRGTVVLASAGLKGLKRDFEMRQDLLTPQYTTSCRICLWRRLDPRT